MVPNEWKFEKQKRKNLELKQLKALELARQRQIIEDFKQEAEGRDSIMGGLKSFSQKIQIRGPDKISAECLMTKIKRVEKAKRNSEKAKLFRQKAILEKTR